MGPGLIGKGSHREYFWMSPTLRSLPSARVAFNQAFLPSIFYHTPQTERLKPGDLRKHVTMDIDVEIREATKWRMPTRESSKVSQYAIVPPC